MRKGIVLAGGTGTRLHPLTLAVSKQLLPVYNKPMIYYPLSVLMLGGMRKILIITTDIDRAQFERLLGDGSRWGIELEYAEQPRPTGIPEAFSIAEEFLDGDPCALILGDNLFYGNGLRAMLAQADQNPGATLFAKEMAEPERFGVVEFGSGGEVVSIVEKPASPPSNWVLTGLYFFDSDVLEIARSLRPSERGETEITDVARAYMNKGLLQIEQMGRGFAWLDTGTFASMVDASEFVRVLETQQRLKIGSPEEVAFRMGYIDADQLRAIGETLLNSGYGQGLIEIADQAGPFGS